MVKNIKLKGFEQQVVNRSFTDLLFYDTLADAVLECCNASVKPNTLSFLSFLPLFITSFIVDSPTTINFLLTLIAVLVHQLLDIANKKQAYRLSQFSFSTFYIDHLFDSLSCVSLTWIFSKLLSLTASSSLIAIFLFAMLPFYTMHLAMYNSDYLIFHKINPAS